MFPICINCYFIGKTRITLSNNIRCTQCIDKQIIPNWPLFFKKIKQSDDVFMDRVAFRNLFVLPVVYDNNLCAPYVQPMWKHITNPYKFYSYNMKVFKNVGYLELIDTISIGSDKQYVGGIIIVPE